MTSEFDLDDIDLSDLEEKESVVLDNRENLETVIWGVTIALAIFVALWLILRMFVNTSESLDILSAMNTDDHAIAAQ